MLSTKAASSHRRRAESPPPRPRSKRRHRIQRRSGARPTSSAAPGVKPPRRRNNARRVSATRRRSHRRRPPTRPATGRPRAHRPKRRPSRPRPTAEAGAMAEISAKDIAALRKQTGAGMLDCRTALQETGGDIDAAKDWLRTKGLAGAAKRAGREPQDGAVEVTVEGNVGAIVELNCETDFVAKGAEFRGMVAALTKIVAEQGDDDLESRPYEGGTVGEAVKQLGATLGENVGIGRVARIESADGIVDGYKHVQNERGTIGVLVELGGINPSDGRAQEVAHDVALHIASAAPQYVTRDDVPADVLEKERSVLEELTRNEGKPEQAVPKIVEGRLNGFYKNTVLVEQPFVRDPKTTVGKLVGELGKDATIRRFVRIQVGAE